MLSNFVQDENPIQQADKAFEVSVQTGDPLIAMEFINRMRNSGIQRGLAIAKTMYLMSKNWNLFEAAGVGDGIYNLIEAYTGYAIETVSKYVGMWENVFENPQISDEMKTKLSMKPIGDLLLLSAAASDGSLTGDQWDKVVIAPDTQAVRSVVREARGDVTSSKNTVTLMLVVRDDGKYPAGALVASYQGASELVGSINIEADSEVGKRAVAKIKNSLKPLEV